MCNVLAVSMCDLQVLLAFSNAVQANYSPVSKLDVLMFNNFMCLVYSHLGKCPRKK